MKGLEAHGRLRWVAPAAGLALLALFAFLWRFDRGAYFALMNAWATPALDQPFDDWRAVVHLMHCANHGVNVYVTSLCGTFSYSPLWFWARLIPLAPAWTIGFGLTIAATFYLSLWFVFRPRSWREAITFAFAAISPMAVYGAERANVDLILFVLVVAGGVLLDGGGARRAAGYAFIALAGLLKFYPMAGLVVIVRERTKVFIPIAIASVLGLAVLITVFGRQLAAAVASLPSARWTVDGIAATNLWRGMQDLAPSRALAAAMPLLVVAGAVGLAVRLASRRDLARRLEEIDIGERTLLALGAAIIASFYFLSQPIAYHGIFLAPVLGGLIAMRRDADPQLKRILTLGSVAVLTLMWEPAARFLIVAAGPRAWILYWLARELIGWALMALLTAILARYCLDGGALARWRVVARPPATAR